MRTKRIIAVLALGTLLLSVGLLGCKQEPDEATPAQTTDPGAEQPAVAASEEAAQAVAAAQEVEQTTCPVMGKAIDKAIFVEYQGKKVFFCCEPCKEKFQAEPAKYVADLPQFGQAAQPE